MNIQEINKDIGENNFRLLSRAISYIENKGTDYFSFLQKLPIKATPIIGLTGPPGVGKSTLLNSVASYFAQQHKKLAVLCIDPSSPVNFGTILGDRYRLTQAIQYPNVYIRSFSNRGKLGGLNAAIWEICWLLLACDFDYIIIETVGVGQNEIDICTIAKPTVVVLSPDSGDELQFMKAGLMEIADIFVINKFDHPNAQKYWGLLTHYLHEQGLAIPIVKTIANQPLDVAQLIEYIHKYSKDTNAVLLNFLTEIVYKVIEQTKMKCIQKTQILNNLKEAMNKSKFNLISIINSYL